jgi:hypothetical protein
MRVLNSVLGRLRQAWGQPMCQGSCPPACAMHRTSTFSLRRERPVTFEKVA